MRNTTDRANTHRSDMMEVDGHRTFRVDIAEIPLEVFAFQSLAQSETFADITRIDALQF